MACKCSRRRSACFLPKSLSAACRIASASSMYSFVALSSRCELILRRSTASNSCVTTPKNYWLWCPVMTDSHTQSKFHWVNCSPGWLTRHQFVNLIDYSESCTHVGIRCDHSLSASASAEASKWKWGESNICLWKQGSVFLIRPHAACLLHNIQSANTFPSPREFGKVPALHRTAIFHQSVRTSNSRIVTWRSRDGL